MPHYRVMLLGAAGQVGQAVQFLAARSSLPVSWDMAYFSRTECDITNPAALRDAMQTVRPDLVINGAGLSLVDEAEREPEIATAVNFHAVAQMAAQCSTLDVPLIHLSTDYVFDGLKASPYLPDDLMNPISKYGASKVMGEEAIRHELPFHVILRVSSIFGPFRRNLLTTLLGKAASTDALRLANDIIAAPTPALDVARALVVMGTAILEGKKDGYGTFHLCGTPSCSRYDFAKSALALYEPHVKQLARLTPASSSEWSPLRLRPRYSVLDCAKIETVYGITQKPWVNGLRESIEILVASEKRLR